MQHVTNLICLYWRECYTPLFLACKCHRWWYRWVNSSSKVLAFQTDFVLSLIQEWVSICECRLWAETLSHRFPKFLCYCDRVAFSSFHTLALQCGHGSFFLLWLDYVNKFSKHGPHGDHLHPGGTSSYCSDLLRRGCRKSHWSAMAKAENSCWFPGLFILFHFKVQISLHLPLPSAVYADSFHRISSAQCNNLVCVVPTASQQK